MLQRVVLAGVLTGPAGHDNVQGGSLVSKKKGPGGGDAVLVKRLRHMAEVRVVVRDAKDAEIDKLRAEKLLLERNNKARGTGEAAAPSAPSKSLQRLAIECLFAPVSHQNTAAMMTLYDELGLDNSNVDSAETMLAYMDSSHLQRLAACLKVGPQGLFKKAFLATSLLVPFTVEGNQQQQTCRLTPHSWIKAHKKQSCCDSFLLHILILERITTMHEA